MMLDQMKWLGHDTFKIESGGKVIYTDPFQLKDGLPKAALSSSRMNTTTTARRTTFRK